MAASTLEKPHSELTRARVAAVLEDVRRRFATPVWDYHQAFSRHDGLLTRDEQERLRCSRVAIVGMGGVGGVHLVTLARLGIGRFTIADFDHFELANMNRQHGARLDTLGRSKVEVMAEEALAINPELDLNVLRRPIGPDNIDEFLDGADLLVDGIDFFAIEMRRRLFRRAARRGLYGITAGPIGFSTAWLTFDPAGMPFDRYFDLADGQTETEQLIAFAVGLAPALLHRPYIDASRVDFGRRRGPSAGLACQLCAGVAAAEALKLLIGRGSVRCAPYYQQFDAYRGMLRRGYLRFGNRHPVQRLKRWWLKNRLAGPSAVSRT